MKYQHIILSVLLAGLFLGTQAVQAQESGNEGTEQTAQKAKKRNWSPEEFLPQAGDFAFSINANPFVNFVGNMFNRSTNNRIDNTQIGGQSYIAPMVSLAGKYMITDHFGVRLNVGWIYSYQNTGFYTRDDAAFFNNPLSHQKVKDRYAYTNAGGSFNGAVEYRIGNRRIQGVVGGGLIYAFTVQRERFTYGNAITELNPNPSTALTEYQEPISSLDGFMGQRCLSRYQGNPTHHLGLMGFVGFEWFLCPWFSLGAEVNVSALYNWSQEVYEEVEGFNTLTGQREKWTELISPRSHGVNFGTGNIGANLTLTFYFNRNSNSTY
ncbi:MAG: hypothetical protein NC048_05530 [Bacteroides sp.]|nr:hypothetical protein [Ruminococcus flavefaciens]MCM1554938.1 hypothetical protein [Bacteroides sp.]